MKIKLLINELNESKENYRNVCNQLDDLNLRIPTLIAHIKKIESQLQDEKKQHHDSKEEVIYLEKEMSKSEEKTQSIEKELTDSLFANNQLKIQIKKLLPESETTMNLNLLDSIFTLPGNTEEIHKPAQLNHRQVIDSKGLEHLILVWKLAMN